MSLKDDLIAAKQLIDTPDSWVKKISRVDDYAYCAVGAIGAVFGPGPLRAPARAALGEPDQ